MSTSSNTGNHKCSVRKLIGPQEEVHLYQPSRSKIRGKERSLVTGPLDLGKSRGQILRTWPRKFLFENQKRTSTSATKTQDRLIECYVTFRGCKIGSLCAGFNGSSWICRLTSAPRRSQKPKARRLTETSAEHKPRRHLSPR